MLALAKVGLSYSENPYDIERYTEIRDRSVQVLGNHTDIDTSELSAHFEKLDDYPTPKVDVRGVVFRDHRILLVREQVDGCWAMPGGWAEIGFSPSENVVKEVREESGLEVEVDRLLAMWDKAKHGHPPDAFAIYKLNFLCKETGGSLGGGHEVTDVGFFPIDQLPELSTPRNTAEQIRQLYQLAQTGSTVFD